MGRRRQEFLPGLPGEPFDFAQLSRWERIAFDLIVEAAEARRPAPTAQDFEEACGCTISTTVRLVKMLEGRGLIKVDRYQRSRRMKVIATGKATAPVKNKTPHWRTRPRPTSMPAPALTRLRERTPDFAQEIMRAARADHMEIGDFLAELAWAGWLERKAAIQAETDKE